MEDYIASVRGVLQGPSENLLKLKFMGVIICATNNGWHACDEAWLAGALADSCSYILCLLLLKEY
jgi:hypothetical protein